MNKVILWVCQFDLAHPERRPGRVAVPHRLASRHPAWRDQVAEFASSFRKGAHIHVTGYLRSLEIESKGAGRDKKSGAGVKVQAWEVRAIWGSRAKGRIASADQQNLSPPRHQGTKRS